MKLVIWVESLYQSIKVQFYLSSVSAGWLVMFLSLVLFSPPNLGGRLAYCHQTSTHVHDDQVLQIYVRTLACPSQNFGSPKTSKFRRDFGQLCNLIANISCNATCYRHSGNSIQTAIISLKAYLIWWTLVYKCRKIGTYSFDPANGRAYFGL